jgi:hypothetical protein
VSSTVVFTEAAPEAPIVMLSAATEAWSGRSTIVITSSSPNVK